MASADPLLHGKLAAELIKEKDQGLIMIRTELGLGFYLKSHILIFLKATD